MSKSNRSGKATCLTPKKLEKFLSQLPEKYSLLAETMYFSAGRVGEITSLRVRNINFRLNMIILEKSSTKTKETRQIPLPSRLIGDIKAWILHNELVEDDFIFFSASRNTRYASGERN